MHSRAFWSREFSDGATSLTASKKSARYDKDKHCGGKKKSDGKPCTRPKGWGTKHPGFGACKLHGGSTGTGEKAGQLQAANHLALVLGAPIATNPYDSIKALEAEAKGYVEFFRREVERIDPDCHFVRPTSILRRPLNEGKEGEDPSITVEEITEAPLDLHIAIKAHERAMENLRRISKTAFDVNLADRLAKMQENDSQALFVAVRGIVLALGHKLEDPRVQGIVTKHLAAIDATAEEM